MTKILPTPEQTEDDQADRASIRDLLEGGMEMAREMARQVLRPNLAWHPADEVAAAYDRLSRAMRRAILLARRFDDGADPDRSRADAAFHRAALKVLREAAAAIRRGITLQATTPAPFVPGLPIADAGLAFDRLARALRRTMLLNRVIGAHPVPKRHRAAAATAAAQLAEIPYVPPAPPGPGPIGPNPQVVRLDAAHDALHRADPADTLDSPEQLDRLDLVPGPHQLPAVQAALRAALAPVPRRSLSRDRVALRAQQSARMEEWLAHPHPEPGGFLPESPPSRPAQADPDDPPDDPPA